MRMFIVNYALSYFGEHNIKSICNKLPRTKGSVQKFQAKRSKVKVLLSWHSQKLPAFTLQHKGVVQLELLCCVEICMQINIQFKC